MADKKKKSDKTTRRPLRVGRRGLLKGLGVTGAALAFPHIWVPREVMADTVGRGTAKHLIYIRLSGGFRFTTAFNGDVADEFNPFGLATGVAEGTEWGPTSILAGNTWRTEEIAALGVQTVPQIANDIAVYPTVDHEPLSGSADGNHQTGLERFLTGYVGGDTGVFTMINYGLKDVRDEAFANGEIILPAMVMGNAGIGRGAGVYAAYRPPVISGAQLDLFATDITGLLPQFAIEMTAKYDERFRDRQNLSHYPKVDSYLQSREATKAYADIFNSEALKIGNGSDELFDGISNRELETVFGNDGTAQNLRLALRLFHFGCPAVYMDQGGYDYHSDEEMNLPGRIEGVNQILAGLNYVLKKMEHPAGGTYWDHTIVAMGSEFSRTARGSRFNSARGSDHGGDDATRWMAMPFMGGPIVARGRMLSQTRASDLKALGKVVSYRSTMKTLMDALACEHDEFFPADEPYDDLFV